MSILQVGRGRFFALLFLAVLLFFVGFSRPAHSQSTSGANIKEIVNAAYAKYKGLNEGKNADYIPALAKVPSNLFGIVLITPDGQVYTAGDIDHLFSIQSISKVFTMAEVMKEGGPEILVNT